MIVLIAIFVFVPIAELYVIFKIGDAIGWEWTLLFLVVDSLLGSWLMRSQGRAAWRRFQLAMQEGRVPHREVLDGVLVIFGGAFLITPGFLTDVIGVLCLLPPTRGLMRRLVVRGLGRRMGLFVATGNAETWDVEGTAYEHPEGHRQTPHDPPRIER